MQEEQQSEPAAPVTPPPSVKPVQQPATTASPPKVSPVLMLNKTA